MDGMPMSLETYKEKYGTRLDIIHVNHELRILYTSVTSLYLQCQNEFNMIIAQEKKDIANRPYILDRFEPWEIVGEFNKTIRLTLMSRARNNDERKIVGNYIKTLKP